MILEYIDIILRGLKGVEFNRLFEIFSQNTLLSFLLTLLRREEQTFRIRSYLLLQILFENYLKMSQQENQKLEEMFAIYKAKKPLESMFFDVFIEFIFNFVSEGMLSSDPKIVFNSLQILDQIYRSLVQGNIKITKEKILESQSYSKDSQNSQIS